MRRLLLLALLTLCACAPTIAPGTSQDGSPPGGSSFVIHGTGFATVTAVTLSGVPASFTIVSPTEIQGTAAPGPVGYGDIVVTNPDGSATCVGCWVYEPDVPEPTWP